MLYHKEVHYDFIMLFIKGSHAWCSCFELRKLQTDICKDFTLLIKLCMR